MTAQTQFKPAALKAEIKAFYTSLQAYLDAADKISPAFKRQTPIIRDLLAYHVKGLRFLDKAKTIKEIDAYLFDEDIRGNRNNNSYLEPWRFIALIGARASEMSAVYEQTTQETRLFIRARSGDAIWRSNPLMGDLQAQLDAMDKSWKAVRDNTAFQFVLSSRKEKMDAVGAELRKTSEPKKNPELAAATDLDQAIIGKRMADKKESDPNAIAKPVTLAMTRLHAELTELSRLVGKGDDYLQILPNVPDAKQILVKISNDALVAAEAHGEAVKAEQKQAAELVTAKEDELKALRQNLAQERHHNDILSGRWCSLSDIYTESRGDDYRMDDHTMSRRRPDLVVYDLTDGLVHQMNNALKKEIAAGLKAICDQIQSAATIEAARKTKPAQPSPA